MTCATRRSKGLMPVIFSATAEDLCSVYIERSHIGPGASASVLVLEYRAA